MMVIFLIIICLIYFYLGGFTNNRKSIYFIAGYFLIILSVGSPLHFLGENYLMSAHMLLSLPAPRRHIGYKLWQKEIYRPPIGN